MAPMENHGRGSTISRSDPHIRNKQRNKEGTNYIYDLEYKYDLDFGDIEIIEIYYK